MIAPFTYQALPMRVGFGAGSVAKLPDEVAALGLTEGGEKRTGRDIRRDAWAGAAPERIDQEPDRGAGSWTR